MAASKRKRGRPLAWNEQTALICGYALGRGLSIDEVAKEAGISRSTLYARLNDGALGTERFQRLAELLASRDSSNGNAAVQQFDPYESGDTRD